VTNHRYILYFRFWPSSLSAARRTRENLGSTPRGAFFGNRWSCHGAAGLEVVISDELPSPEVLAWDSVPSSLLELVESSSVHPVTDESSRSKMTIS
jgi:hypothetical protein